MALNVATNFGPPPNAATYEQLAEAHIRAHKDIDSPAYFKPQFSKPMKFIDFEYEYIIFTGWAIEVAVPTKSLTSFHAMLDDDDFSMYYIKFKDGRVVASTITEADASFTANDKETYARAKGYSYVVDADGNKIRARDYGATLGSGGRFKFFRNIDYSSTNTAPSTHSTQAVKSSSYSELIELKKLNEQGVITDAEFTAAKKKILGL